VNKTSEVVTDVRPQVAAAKHLKMDLAKLEVVIFSPPKMLEREKSGERPIDRQRRGYPSKIYFANGQ
jgi:hypothetical protein